jgi:hypothetical protein
MPLAFEEVNLEANGPSAQYINIVINKLLTQATCWQTVLYIFRDLSHLFERVNAATSIHRLGRWVRNTRSLHKAKQVKEYGELMVMAEALGREFTPRGLANALWGLGALGDKNNIRLAESLFELVPLNNQPNKVYKVQELSNLVWAMGTLEIESPQVLDFLLDVVVSRLDECIPQALSNICWGCATLRHKNETFLNAVSHHAVTQIRVFQCQTLANILWAYSILCVWPEELFMGAAKEMINRLKSPDTPRFKAQELSNILIAFARGNIMHPELMQSMEDELCEGNGDRLVDFSSQALGNTLWAFATLRWYPVRLLPIITRVIGKRAHELTAQEISNSIWAYARFAYHPGRLMAIFIQEIESRVEEFSGQSCTNLLWAMAVLTATHCKAFVMLLDRFKVLDAGGEYFVELQYCQVLQAALLAQFERRGSGSTGWRPEVDLKEETVDRALAFWGQQQKESSKVSAFHLDVSDALNSLGVEHHIEFLTANDLFSVDIAIVDGGDKKIAVEVDGPYHFPVNSRTPLGHTMIRRRLLRASGWTVIPVPWFDWFAIETSEQRANYLAKKLAMVDARMMVKDALKTETGDLLSTNFAAGPQSPFSSRDDGDIAGKTDVFTTSSQDYDIFMSPSPSDAVQGLQEALISQRVSLTAAAYRRLQAMGLEIPEEAALISDTDGEAIANINMLPRPTGDHRRPYYNNNNYNNNHNSNNSNNSGTRFSNNNTGLRRSEDSSSRPSTPRSSSSSSFLHPSSSPYNDNRRTPASGGRPLQISDVPGVRTGGVHKPSNNNKAHGNKPASASASSSSSSYKNNTNTNSRKDPYPPTKRNRFPAAPEWARHPINMNYRKNPMALKPRSSTKSDASGSWRGEGSTEDGSTTTTTPDNKSPPLSPSQQQQQQRQQQQQYRSEDAVLGNLQQDNAERYSFQREQLRILREQEARQSSSSSPTASGSSGGDRNEIRSPVSNEDTLLKYVTEAGSSNAREPSSSSSRLVPYKSQQQKISRNNSSSPYSSPQKDNYNHSSSSSSSSGSGTNFKRPSISNISNSSTGGRTTDKGFMVETTGDAVTDLANELSLDELRILCQRLGLPVSGRKAQLAERIIEFKASKTGGSNVGEGR